MYVGKGQRGSPGTYFAEPGAGEFCLACQHTSMLQLGCRRRNLSLISLIVLALSNMLLTFLLLQSENCTPENLPKEIEAVVVTEWSLDSVDRANRFRGSDDVQEQLQKPCPTTESYLSTKDDDTMRFDIRLGRWDSKRLFRTFDSVIVGTNYPQISRRSKSCLATQSSLEKLHSLVQVAHHWTGPISVALYAAGEEEFDALQYYLVYLRRCYTPIRERVNFSLAVPKNRAPERQPRAMELLENFDCAKPEATLTEIVARISSEQMSWRARNVYPQNHMRNLARKNCQTEWIFLTDVDIVPCINMTTRLDEFLTTGPNNCDKCAYVVPTYELDIRVRFPPNKTELVRLAKKGLARPFHQKVFIHNQFATNFTKWVMDVNTGAKGHENVQTGKIYVSHDVTNFEFFYEPFYVAKDVAPAHDERFIGYGYTRNTQPRDGWIAHSGVKNVKTCTKK
ncbi:beta-1,4-glucuronyltransferase 1 isoform X2 [Venturia canescens]|uniref:beta-1,4-glucuronyltransferase 1 isoform X2 n=1 Tax=Venturia canescens TaxID=32260 RepID=UPI001C9C6D25|nr:beta-1,4-glucuronyltransferase 1 isoform X2 [Venturia canescens]